MEKYYFMTEKLKEIEIPTHDVRRDRRMGLNIIHKLMNGKICMNKRIKGPGYLKRNKNIENFLYPSKYRCELY